MTGAERAWFVQHADDLVDTMANRSAPDVVGLTRTNVTYGVIGDHGGSQKLVQNIPMVFYGPGVELEGLEPRDAAGGRDADDPEGDGNPRTTRAPWTARR